MKGKLAFLALLSTIVTVGGVYATWTFAEGNTNTADVTAKIGMTGVSDTTEKGTIAVKINQNGGVSLSIDDANNDHKPEIKKEGVMLVEFKPSASASEEIKTKGIDVQCTISFISTSSDVTTLEGWTYGEENTQIFSISHTTTTPLHLDNDLLGQTSEDPNAITFSYNQETDTFTWTVPASQLGIDLTEEMKDVLIDTRSDYDILASILNKGEFKITVSECDGTAHNN